MDTPPTEGSHANLDGGRAALAGFLYQLAGSAALVASAYLTADGTGSADLEALITLARHGNASVEEFGQDLVVRLPSLITSGAAFLPNELVLVQFKYSLQPQQNAVGLADYRDIAERLVDSRDKAVSKGFIANRTFLVTNRPLVRQPNEIASGPRYTGSKNIRSSWTEAETELLNCLQVVGSAQLSAWYNDLIQFGREYGCLSNEIRKGVTDLIGRLVQATLPGGDNSVTLELLRETIIGDVAARPLTAVSVLERSKELVLSYAGANIDSVLTGPDAIVRRTVFEEITRHALDHALVFVVGLGGCGKSVALWQWAAGRIYAPLPSTGPFTAISSAQRAKRSWIKDEVLRWAGLDERWGHPRQTDPPPLALQRLVIANEDLDPPLLHLSLDGIDEMLDNIEQKTVISDILSWFWQEEKDRISANRPPRATLVVTCRSESDIDAARTWLGLDNPNIESGEFAPAQVRVEDFSPEELREAASRTSDKVRARLDRALARSGQVGQFEVSGPVPVVAGSQVPSTPAVSQELLKALRHPAMWRSLLHLDPDVQEEVLGPSMSNADPLARRFVEWVLYRLTGPGSFFTSMEARALLISIAVRASHEHSELHSQQDTWIDAGRQTGIGTDLLLKLFLNRAVSIGLVERVGSGTWRWKHPFVAAYLAKQEPN